jgi:TolA-binding protein
MAAAFPTDAMSVSSVNELTSRLQLAQMQEQQEAQAQVAAARAKSLELGRMEEQRGSQARAVAARAEMQKLPATNFAVAEAEESGYGSLFTLRALLPAHAVLGALCSH